MTISSHMVAVAVLSSFGLNAQTNYYYRGADATGRLRKTAVTNVSQAAASFRLQGAFSIGREIRSKIVYPQPRVASTRLGVQAYVPIPNATSLKTGPATSTFNFLGLTHYDQRYANFGNQLNVEPPSPDIAAANGWVLEGVNSAIQVYSAAGVPLLGRPLSTNELFAVPASYDRAADKIGVVPTDMRVFYDHGIDRWFVVQRAQDYDVLFNPLNSSHLYIAVSQTGNPTGAYTIYTMDTTNASRPGCPCFSDFPQIGADNYGIYISVDEYDTSFGWFAGVRILAISKQSLAVGSAMPTIQEIVVPRLTGFEATVRPAITPPGASYALGRGGVEFFLSTQSQDYSDNRFALWALTNTASLNTTPDLVLMQSIVPGVPYTYPDVATQRPGNLPFGSTLTPPGQLALIHGGRDSRVLSLVYAGGRLFVTFATDLLDEGGKRVVGGGYAVLFLALRDQLLTASVWRYGYLALNNNHVLRPAVAVTAQGRGAIAFTIVGPDHYPGAAFVPVDGFTPSNIMTIAAPGAGPEDGFTGYPDNGFITTGVARWGDYSGATATADGSIWMTVEYIPDAIRSEIANWGTRVIRRAP